MIAHSSKLRPPWLDNKRITSHLWLQLMTQDVGKTEQLQGDHEERRGSTT